MESFSIEFKWNGVEKIFINNFIKEKQPISSRKCIICGEITSNAEECYRGRCTALKYKNCELDWKGFIAIWKMRQQWLLIIL